MPEDLNTFLSLNAGKRILFAGIGNLLRMDDGVGVYISSGIRETNNISAITVEVSLSNYIGKINSLNPDVLVLIDCVEMNTPPGTSRLVPVDRIKDFTFNTHNISLKRFNEFFKMPVFLLGIQPEKIKFGENISYIVKKEADNIINAINSY